jgi:hypothetical protein
LIGDTEYEVSPSSQVVACAANGENKVGAVAEWHRVVYP